MCRVSARAFRPTRLGNRAHEKRCSAAFKMLSRVRPPPDGFLQNPRQVGTAPHIPPTCTEPALRPGQHIIGPPEKQPYNVFVFPSLTFANEIAASSLSSYITKLI